MKQMIKNVLILLFMLSGLSINIEGQTKVWIETPKGSDVEAWTNYTEWNDSLKNTGQNSMWLRMNTVVQH